MSAEGYKYWAYKYFFTYLLEKVSLPKFEGRIIIQKANKPNDYGTRNFRKSYS